MPDDYALLPDTDICLIRMIEASRASISSGSHGFPAFTSPMIQRHQTSLALVTSHVSTRFQPHMNFHQNVYHFVSLVGKGSQKLLLSLLEHGVRIASDYPVVSDSTITRTFSKCSRTIASRNKSVTCCQ
jgi:hypothetical protein